LGTGQFADWVTDFEAAAEQRRADGDPDRAHGAKLDAAIVRSLQRFQLGESGNGANLAAKPAWAGTRAAPGPYGCSSPRSKTTRDCSPPCWRP
jgi:hypothetical protein